MSEKKQMLAALGVIALDPKIRAFLEANDPKALDQVNRAIEAGKAAEGQAMPREGEFDPEMIDLTPNYKNMFRSFVRNSQSQAKELIVEARAYEPQVSYNAVHTMLYGMNMALQTASDGGDINELRDVFSTIVSKSAAFIVNMMPKGEL